MNREGLLSSLKGLSKNVYSREELLPEMDLLEEEMAQIVFEDGLDIPSEYVHMSYIMKRLHIMNNEAGDMYKVGRYENFDSHLGAKMDFRAEIIQQLLKDAGFENMRIEKVVVFTNNRIQIKKDYHGFRVCFLSRLPHLIDDFYGTGVIQFTKHLQQMADYIQGKDLNEYYPFEMDVQEFKEAFVDAYLKIKGYDQPVEDGLFTRFRTAIHSLFNMPTTQHVSY